jgi:hypothetical protein
MKILTIFRAPVFHDPEDSRSAELLGSILFFTLAFATVFAAIIALVFPGRIERSAVLVGSIAFMTAISFVFIRVGRVKLAAISYLFFFWLLLSGLSITAGGSAAPAFSGYIVLVLSAGLLLGLRGGVITSILCFVTEIIIIQAQMRGMLSAGLLQNTPNLTAFVQSLFFAWVVVYVFFYRRSIDAALTQTKQELKERQQAEKATRESEEAFKDAQRLAHVGSSSWDARTDKTIWSDELYRIVGRDPALPAPTHAERARIYTPDSFAKLDAAVKQSLAAGEPYDLELEIVRPDGEHREVRARGEADRGDDGAITVLRGTLQDITDQKRAEKKLVASEELFRVAFQNALAGVCLVGTDGKFLEINHTLSDMLGYTEEELLQLTFNDITYEEDRTIGATFFAEALAGAARNARFEKRYVHKSGRLIWAQVSTALLDQSSDGKRYFITYIQDITDQKAATASLKKSEERFRTLIEKAPTAIHISKDGTVAYANQKFLEMYGFGSLDELYGMPIENHWSPEWRPIIRDRIRLRDQGQPLPSNYEGVGMRSDGSFFPVEVYVAHIELSEGPARIGFYFDISERKEAQEKILESEERYRTLIESAPDAIYTLSTDGTLKSLNTAFEKITGWKRDEWIGKVFTKIVHPEDAALAAEGLTNILGGKESTLRELRVEKKTGGYITGEFLSYPQTKEGKVVGVLGIARDITERKLLEEQLRRTQRLDSIGSLAGGIAHDLNNVLAPILLSLEILSRKTTGDQEASLIDAIRASAKRGSEIVKQVLTFARGNEGEFAPQQLRYTVKEIESFVKQTFPKNITFRTDLPKDLSLIDGDQTQLHQVLLNLCVNARDAMPGGGSINISAQNVIVNDKELVDQPDAKPGQYVALSVSDTGSGIPQEIRNKIFEPFFTTKEIGKGTGLGLSTVFSIIRGHRGFLRLDSEVGKGTVFTVYFPVSAKGSMKQEDRAPGASPRGNGEGILVVDDELTILRIAKETLEAYGYKVETASSGLDALSLVSAKPQGAISLVLTDYNMPGMDGAGLARQLRRFLPRVKILVSSGSIENLTKFKGIEIDDFLPKPFTAEQMLENVHKLLQKQ